MQALIFLVLLTFTSSSNGARILAFIPTPSYSHQLVYQPLWKELSLRGHQVTVLTTDPMKDPSLTNLTEIDLHSSYEVWNKHYLNMVNAGGNLMKMFKVFNELFSDLVTVQMEHPFVDKLLNDNSLQFDVVLVESFAIPIAFAKKFDCPLIGIWTAPLLEFFYTIVGSPTHPILYPDPLMKFDKPETFLERVTSVVTYICMNFFVAPYVDRLQDQVIEKYFGKGFGTTQEIVSNTSLIFVNQNPIFDGARPVVPAVIYIGGIHNPTLKPLPKELKAVLDSASDGFIYFSLGTNVKSKDTPPDTLQIILDTFSELPYKVLWKFELDSLDNKPDNVIISKWFPQSDLLKHPNIKLFITHGGLASLEEAVRAKVPMIAIPFFGDQFRNVRKMVRKGIALPLDFSTLNKREFKNTILEAIGNQKYRYAVGEISDLVRDEPMTGLERAVWWTEYVIRHRGAAHLKSPLIDIPWYQYLLLDVIAFLVLITVICLLLLVIVLSVTRKYLQKIFGVTEKQKEM